MKQRYALRVQRGDVTAATVIGEYTINATPEGIRQLIAAEAAAQFAVRVARGIARRHHNSAPGYIYYTWTLTEYGKRVANDIARGLA